MNPVPARASRNACAFHGALQSILAVRGITPLIHSTAGCGYQQYLSSLHGGGGGAGFTGGPALPSTNIIERQVIFGGGARLREQIKNAVKVMDGDLYAVITGCAAAMVGDDTQALVREAKDQGFPVMAVNAPGFCGSAQHGYQLFLTAILNELAPTADHERIPGLVNIFGLLPQHHVFWEGDLTEITRVLGLAGLRTNSLFGWHDSLQDLHRLYQAEVSLVLSPWGLPAARYLEQEYGIPYLDFGYLPVGSSETEELLTKLAEILPAHPFPAELLAHERQREAHYLRKIADLYYAKGFQQRFAVVGESSQAIGLVRFLTATLGLIPASVIITDNPLPELRPALEELFNQLEPSPEHLLFTEDQGEIHAELLARDVELVLGSGLEQEAAGALSAPLLQLSFPVTDHVPLGSGYAGNHGALRLVEELTRVHLQRKI